MKYAFLGLAFIGVGLFGVAFIVMLQSITINNESEYYVLKEAMQAAMLESIDIDCYRSSEQEGCGGVLKISEQKFVENFTRRFTESINGDASQYKLQFYDIIESPPKASVVIQGLTGNFMEKYKTHQEGTFTISNSLDGILELKRMLSISSNTYHTIGGLDIDDPVDTSVGGNGSSVSIDGGTPESIEQAYSCENNSDTCLNDDADESDTGDDVDD